MGWATLLLGVGQMALGASEKDKANKDAKEALAKRTPYNTPGELFKILQATENFAQQGFDPTTLQYLTDQTDRAFTSSLGTAQLLGANPNDVSSLFDQKMQTIMKIGAENHSLNMENFSKYLSAEQMIGASKDAEWQDKENKVKDLQQQAAIAKGQATQQISEGLNTTISGLGQLGTDNLYTDKDSDKFEKEFGAGSSEEAYAKQNNLSYNAYKRKEKKVGKKLTGLGY